MMYCVCVAIDAAGADPGGGGGGGGMLEEVTNLYGSPPSLRRRRRRRRCPGVHRPGQARSSRPVPLVDLLRGPREMSDPGNVPLRPPGGAPTGDGTFGTKALPAKDKPSIDCKEWSAHRSQGVLLRAPGDAEGCESFGIFPISNSGGNRNNDPSIKIKKITRIYDGSTKFPKLEECAHFHYDLTELGQVQVCMNDENQENVYRTADGENPDPLFYLRVTSNAKCWTIRRNHDNFRMFDKQLHRCIFDRKYSMLPELRKGEPQEEDVQGVRKLLGDYLTRFSAIAGSMINCGPILSWLEMDNRGNRLIVTDDSAINTPAIAAAHATKRYNAHANDEISFEVGDIISIIDMPPPDETVWWRGKRGFEVGFFPSEYVEVIGDRIPPAMASQIPETPPKPGPVTSSSGPSSSSSGCGEPVLRKRGKLISFLRMFFNTRPTRTTLKRTGIVKERVFGCDLGEHLLNSGHDVPLVLKSCAEVIESHGIVDGIYRLSGVASNIQKLRVEFDDDQLPDLQSETYLQDIHSISSLLKMYLRELPNPLLTYQLYDKFAAAVQDEENRLMKLHDVVQQLPPPHYRTAEYLIRHLARVAAYGSKTGMHWKNLAIVWAPNLLRSKELETSCNVAALQGVGIQAVVTEYLIMYSDIIFSDKMPTFSASNQHGSPKKSRPKSLAVSTPTKLLSLEEARERALNVSSNAASPKLKYIDVGGGPETLPVKYHTVIDWPHKKKTHRKGGKSPVMSGWRSLFTRGRGHDWRSKQKYSLQAPSNVSPHRLTTTNDHALTEDDIAQRRKLRTVKSADSLLAVSLNPCGKADPLSESSVSATVNSSYASKPGEGPSYMRKPSEVSEVTVQSEGGMRPLSKRSVSYDMYYSESDMETADISPTDDVVFITKPYTDVDSHSSHSSWSHHGAVAMETCDPSYSRMADLEGRFYSHQRHQRHLSDSESLRSQGSYARAAVATGYAPSKSPTFRTFDGASTGRSPRMHDSSRSPRMYAGSKASRSFDGGRSPRMDMQAHAVETDDDNYYDAVSQILGTQSKASVSSHGKVPSPSPLGSGLLTTFQPLPVTVAPTITTSTSVPLGLSPEMQPDTVSPMAVSPRSPSLKERIVKALSPPTLRKKIRSPSPSRDEQHSPVSSPPVAKSRKSRSKVLAPSPPTSPKTRKSASSKNSAEREQAHQQESNLDVQETHFDIQETHFDVQETHFDVQETHFDVQETHFDVNPQAKPLSPIGEMLPVVLQSSPGSRRKNIGQDVSPYEAVSPEEDPQQQLRGRSPLPRLQPPVQPSGDDLLRSLHLKADVTEGDDISEYDNDTLEPPPIPPPRKRRSGEIPVTPGNEQYLNELETAERMLAALGSPQNRMSRALSVPSDLQRSRDTLDTLDMGSIGSFNELSKSLDSLLNGVATHPHQSHQQRYGAEVVGYTMPGGNGGHLSPEEPKQGDWSLQDFHGLTTVGMPDLDYDLQFDLETSPVSPEQIFNVGASLVGASVPLAKRDYAEVAETESCLKRDDVRDVGMAHSMELDANVGTSSDFDLLLCQSSRYPMVTSPEAVYAQRRVTPEPRPGTLDLTSRSSSRSDVKSPVVPAPCSLQFAGPGSPVNDWSSDRAESRLRSPFAQTPDGVDTLQADVLPAQSPTNVTSPTNVHESSRAVTSPMVMSPNGQASAKSKRADWVHAPKASMEETYIDTDSPPMVRKTATEQGSVSSMASECTQGLTSPEQQEDFPSPPPPETPETGMSVSPQWSMPSPPASTDQSGDMDSPPFQEPLSDKSQQIVQTAPLSQTVNDQSPGVNDKFKSSGSEAELVSPEGKVTSVPQVLDRSLDDEVFTMDLEESYEKLEPQEEVVEHVVISEDVVTPVVSTKLDAVPPRDITPDVKSEKDEDLLDRVQVIPLRQQSCHEGQKKTDPVAIMKHMSRSYGGEQLSRDEDVEDSSTSRARSCSGERRPLQMRALSKTPPAVLPKKSRYEKNKSSAASAQPPVPEPSDSGRECKQLDALDSDDGPVKYDDDKKNGGRRQKKRHSPKRQKSVKELLSRFENLGGSPPQEPDSPPIKLEEPKFKPLVFQKPKIVHLKSLSPTHTEPSTVAASCSSPIPAPRKTLPPESSKVTRSPKPAPRSREARPDVEPDSQATTSTNIRAKSFSPVPMGDSFNSGTSDRGDSDEADRALSGSEDSEGSDRKVRKLSLMFERRNSARSDSLEPPVSTLERRKRSDSGRSESPNETIHEENANNRKDNKDVSQSKLQKESDNEKISKQDTKSLEPLPPPRIESSSCEKENISVRHLSQMFERGRASRSQSSDLGNNAGPRSHSSRGSVPVQKGAKPWTAIV